MTTDESLRSPLAPRQFSLAEMMSLLFACAVYFGLLRTTGEYLTGFSRLGFYCTRESQWLPMLSVVVAWLVLLVTYGYWNLRPALRIHFVGPIVYTPILFLICLVAYADKPRPDLLLNMCLAMSYGFFVSVLFGFPIVALMLFTRIMRRQ
jgi:hypothetical protein